MEGRPRFALEVPAACSSAGDGTGGMLPASAGLGMAWLAEGAAARLTQ